MNKVIDPRFFEQPGFLTLFNAWSDVFEKSDGEYVLSADRALAIVEDASFQVEISNQVGKAALISLESVACRYAQEVIFQANEVNHELQ